MNARLEVVSGPQRGEVFDLVEFPVRIGRERSCEVRLVDPESVMSGVHAHLDGHEGRVFLLDKSLNGTELESAASGERREARTGVRVPLEDGDVIVLTPSIRVRFRGAERSDTVPAPQSAVAAPSAAPSAAPAEAKPAAAEKKKDRKRLLLVAIVMFWVTVFAFLSLKTDKDKGGGGDDAAFVAAIGRGDAAAPAVRAFADALGPADWKALQEDVLQAFVEESHGDRKSAARLWAQIDVWARRRAVGAPDALVKDLVRVARDCERRLKPGGAK